MADGFLSERQRRFFETKKKFLMDLARTDPATPSDRGGVCLYSKNGECYVDDSEDHVFIESATGSGKTRRMTLISIIRMLLGHQSVFINDPMMIALRHVAPILDTYGIPYKIINMLNPMCSDTLNLLNRSFEIYKSGDPHKKSQAIGNLMDLAATLIPTKNQKDPFWEMCSQRMFVGFALILFDMVEDVREINMKSIAAMTAGLTPGNSLAEYIDNMPDDLDAKRLLDGVLENSEQTRRCIIGCFNMFMSLFSTNDGLVGMLSGDDAEFYDIYKKPMAIFLIVPDDRDTYGQIVSSIVKMLYDTLADVASSYDDGRLPVRVNFVLDEFSNLSPIESFPSMISASRSKNIRFVLCVQSRYQLTTKYSENIMKTIVANCNILVYMFTQEMETLNEYCRRIGYDDAGCLIMQPRKLHSLDMGRALILKKGHAPFITSLEDISELGVNPSAVNLPAARNQNIPLFNFDRAYRKKSVNKTSTLLDDSEIIEPIRWRRTYRAGGE